MMADLVRMSACPYKSESLDLCSSNFFIHLMDLKSVETQITKVVKQRQHTHTLFQQYRLVACGGSWWSPSMSSPSSSPSSLT
jgi:hypothetical protein